MKLTPWFPADVKPVHVGWYLIQRPTFLAGFCEESMKYWNGRTWCQKKKGVQLFAGVTRWKGLAEKPAASSQCLKGEE